jgi:hypothetical protein
MMASGCTGEAPAPPQVSDIELWHKLNDNRPEFGGTGALARAASAPSRPVENFCQAPSEASFFVT